MSDSNEERIVKKGLKGKAQVAFSPTNRLTTIAALVAIGVSVGGISLVDSLFGSKDANTDVKVAPVNTKKMDIDAGAKKSEHYKESVRKINDKKYSEARQDPTGVAIPFTFAEDEPTQEEGDIDTCGCKIDDEQLLTAIQKLGIGGGKINPKQIGNSDIYVGHKGQLFSPEGESVLWKDRVLYMDKTGLLVDKNANPVMDEEGAEMYLGRVGSVLNSKGVSKKINGRLVTESGRVYASNGQLVTTGSNMRQIAECDIYNTSDGQLVTLDGRGIKYAGIDVFRATQGQLVVRNGSPVTYAGKHLHLDAMGKFTDTDKFPIEAKALLTSKDGIVIDSSCKLQGELKNFKRIGESDIYKDSDGFLVGKNGKALLYNGKKVRVNKDGMLVDEFGNPVRDADGNIVYMNENGEFVTKDGTAIKDGALLTTSEGVGVSADGTLVTKRGNMKRMGESDVYVGSDGLLLDKDGKPLKYKGKNVRVNEGGMLVDENGNPVLDKYGNPVYMAEDGSFVDADGNPIDEVGLLADSDGVVLTADGKKIDIEGGLERLIDKNGNPVMVNGKPVFKGDDGKLYYADGSPVTTPDGKAVYMNKNGNFVDEDGRGVDDVEAYSVAMDEEGRVLGEDGSPLKTKDGRFVYMDENGNYVDENGNLIDESELNGRPALEKVDPEDIQLERLDGLSKMGESDVFVAEDGLLIGKDGKPLLYDGKKVRVDENGQLFDENGNPVLDANGNPVFMNNQGELVDANGRKIKEAGVLTTSDGTLLTADGKIITKDKMSRYGDSDMFKTVDGKLVDKDGKAIKYKGQDVVVGEDGALYTADGRPVTDEFGNKVYLDKDGNLVDKNGKLIDQEGVLETADGVLIGSDGETLGKGGKLTQVGNTNLYRAKDGTLVDAEGKRVQFDGQNAKLDDQGRLLNKFNRPIRIRGKDVYMGADGRLLDKNGKPVLGANGEALYVDGNGNIVDEDGNIVSSEGERMSSRDPADRSHLIVPNKPKRQVAPVPNTKPMTEEKEKNDTTSMLGGDGVVVNKNNPKSVEKAQARYDAIKANMGAAFDRTVAARKRPMRAGIVPVGGNRDSGLTPEELQILDFERKLYVEQKTREGEGSNGNSKTNGGSSNSDSVVLAKKADVLYAVLESRVNSDYPGPVLVTVAGGKLDGATLLGAFERADNKVVISFDGATLPDGREVSLKGVAVDPATSYTAMATDVDYHLIYRYGGLFLSKFIEGFGLAVAESTDRVEQVDATGASTTYSGLEEGKIAVRAAGEVGAAFSEEFKKNVDRPPTVVVDEGTAMGIILMEAATADSPSNNASDKAIAVN